VVGVPDELRGESPKAFVRLKAGEAATEQEMKRFCLERLANYKVPREFVFADSLPKTAGGKIDKQSLQEK
jgi:long-chain acyl-CoA synthetase